MRPLRHQWPWNKGFIRLYLTVPSISGVAAAILLYPSAGSKAMWFLSGFLVSAVFGGVYNAIGARVTGLIKEHRTDAGEVAEALIVIGRLQSPGIAILRQDEVELVPIAGEPFTIPLRELEIHTEGRMLPGKYVWGKRAFILKAFHSTRVAFAVAEPVGTRWSPFLRRESH